MKLYNDIKKFLDDNKDRSIQDVYDDLFVLDSYGNLSKAEKIVFYYLKLNKHRLGII